MNRVCLPTLTGADWTVTALRDSVLEALSDATGEHLRMYFYAVTLSGWQEFRRALRRWRSGKDGRTLIAYVGTDHAITDAEAMRAMVEDGVSVRVMTNYTGVFHPKVVWLQGAKKNWVWIGSNNLTRDGLLNNVEFAALIKSSVVPRTLKRWAQEVHDGSTEATDELLDDYENERIDYAQRRVALGTFTWSKREQLTVRRKRGKRHGSASPGLIARRGDLVLEVMPRETGQDGKQIQLPMAAAHRFFGLPAIVGATKAIALTPAWTKDSRTLTMTIFANHTVRIVVRELDYRDRPCVLLIRKKAGSFSFEIVTRSAFPAKYRNLVQRCGPPTRAGSRRWTILA
ncbi:phospholipase D-like domain-containing protein [Usitatibacter palustris]|uniref:Phospholipase D-like domain-containing protein n=1 Tax=Usitatibacter palustris TaxID=2732487 RepID=A0A6M4H4T5_9PROT|nr:phospholipase D family protein [Usitatibacter palustris]QJR14659.1 hypothetical protein DSM104440_01469 [Usitatibacter palustris]